MVKFDLPKKKPKLFCTFETYFCEKYDIHLYIDQYMTECTFNALAFLYTFLIVYIS